MIPENIHTHPEEGHWKFQGRWDGGDIRKNAKMFKESIKQNWNFQRGGASNRKKNICGRGMDIFWNTLQLHVDLSVYPRFVGR